MRWLLAGGPEIIRAIRPATAELPLQIHFRFARDQNGSCVNSTRAAFFWQALFLKKREFRGTPIFPGISGQINERNGVEWCRKEH